MVHEIPFLHIAIFSLISAGAMGQTEEIKPKCMDTYVAGTDSILIYHDQNEASIQGRIKDTTAPYFAVSIGKNSPASRQEKNTKAVPMLYSAEVYLQATLFPSRYHLFTPRVRFNIGLFSTEYRLGWLSEKNRNEIKPLSFHDWQILQVNIVNKENITWTTGGGISIVNYKKQKIYGEWTASVRIHPLPDWGGWAEMRSSKGRNEGSFGGEYVFFSRPPFYASFSLGLIFQHYFKDIGIGGIQTGLVIRAY